MKFRYFVGIDVSKATLDITLLHEESVLFQERIKNTPDAILAEPAKVEPKSSW